MEWHELDRRFNDIEDREPIVTFGDDVSQRFGVRSKKARCDAFKFKIWIKLINSTKLKFIKSKTL